MYEKAEPVFELSVLFLRNGEGDETRLLLATGATRLELFSRQDPTGLDSLELVKDHATGETFSRRLVLPGGPRPEGCAALESTDACLVFTGKGGRLTVPLSAFAKEQAAAGSAASFGAAAGMSAASFGAAAIRERLSKLVSEGLAKKLLGLAPVYSRSADFDRYRDDFLALVWPALGKRSGAPEVASRVAGCAFDAGFGFPCSDKELARDASLKR